MAVSDLKDYDELWRKYSAEQKEPVVQPALVIQVRPKISEKELGAIVTTLKQTWNVLDGNAVGHAFQEHTTLNLGTRSVRYVAPQDIQDDPDIRVVLFKEALTTGWDCPRAEVMVSLRSAKDYTYIAQLIGRIVRTPLARRIASDDVLNTVALYLPYFDDEHVAEVIKGLESEDSQITSELELNSVVCSRNPAIPKSVWTAFASVPTYTRPGKYHRNDVARLNALAALLVGNHLDEKAIDAARNHLTQTLFREAERLGSFLERTAADLETLVYHTDTVDLASGAIETAVAVAQVNVQDIDQLFRRAKRSFGDAAAKWYWDALCDAGMDPDIAKLRVVALSDNVSVAPALESAAKVLIDTWRKEHNSAITDLPDAKKAQFYNIWQQSKEPEQVALIFPSQITAASAERTEKKHLYANRGLYPLKLTGWENDVLKSEIGKKTLVGWYRNPTGGTAAVAVPYKQSDLSRTMYPDFVFFHEIGSEIVIDLVDPHRPSESDTGPKWAGLGEYARNHGHVFRRVVAVIKSTDGTLVSLDLKNPAVAAAMQKASTETDIRTAFEDFGGNY